MNLNLYVPGGHQGWDPETAPSLYNRNFDFKYEGYVYFNEGDEYKLLPLLLVIAIMAMEVQKES